MEETMEQLPLTPRQLKRALKSRRALKKSDMRITFQPPVRPPRPGIRVFPDPVKGTFIKKPSRSSRQAALAKIDETKLPGFLPRPLALNPHAPEFRKPLRHRQFAHPL